MTLWDDKPAPVLTVNFTKLAVAFHQAIKPEHILQPVSIVLSDTTSEIIDFKILKVTRSVTHLRLVPDSINKNRLGIDLRILEENDGMMGQIIYSAESNPVLEIEGAIEGSPKGFSNAYKGDSWVSTIRFSTVLSVLVLGIIVVALGRLIKYAFKDQPPSQDDEDEPERKVERTLSSTFTTRYQMIIRNEENFAEKTSLGFTYSKLVLCAFLFFIAVFGMSLFLVKVLLGQWFDPRYQPPSIDLPETLSYLNLFILNSPNCH